MQLVTGIPFDEAVNKLGSKTLIGADLKSSEWADVPVALRERAFFSSRIESARVLQRSRDSIADFLQANKETLPDGQTLLKTGSRAAFVDQMKEFLTKEGIDRTDGGITDITSEQRLGLIFEVNVNQAYGYGDYRQGMDADVLDAFPAARFIRVADVKEPRDFHTQFEDQVYLKTDPIWETINEDFGLPYAPFGFGCQHEQEDVSREEAEALGLIEPGQPVQPTEMPSLLDAATASTKTLDPDLLAKLLDDFGDKAYYDPAEQTIQWAKKKLTT